MATQQHRWAALDGLRAVAVVAVMCFHIGGASFSSGVFGVDIFFVLSGFLITSLLLNEHDRFGQVDFKKFFIRRGLRLAPAALATIAVTSVYTTVTASMIHNSTTSSIASIVTFVSNWRILHRAQNNGLLNQFWSLSIEEQFYIALPIALVLIPKLYKRSYLKAALSVAAAGSAVSLWQFARDNSPSWRLFYATETRALSLIVGCLLATALPMILRHQSAWANRLKLLAIGAIALLVIVCATPSLSKEQFVGELVMVALATATLVTQVVASPQSWIALLLSTRPFVAVGRMSYGLYLWHPLVLAILGSGMPAYFHWPLFFAGSLGVAALSLRLVEQPFLRLKADFAR